MIGYTGSPILAMCKFASTKAGLGTVGYQLKDSTGLNVGVRVASGIVEIGHGAYCKALTFSEMFNGSIMWDTGEETPSYAVEDVNIFSQFLTSSDVRLDYLDANVSSAATPTVEQIDALLSSTHGSGLWGGSGGSGSISTTISVIADEIPLDNVAIYVTSDIYGNNIVAGTLYTDTFGEATFLLDAGTYYVWKQLSGFNFTNPEIITVS